MRKTHLREIFITIIFLIVVGGVCFAQGLLTNISVNATNNIVGSAAVYRFTFTTSATGNNTTEGIPRDGKLAVKFPDGFDISGIEIIDSKNDNLTGGFLDPLLNGQIVEITRDNTGNDVLKNTQVVISMAVIVNPDTARLYNFQTFTKTASGDTIDIGTTPNLTIGHGPLTKFDLNISGTATAGDNYLLIITALDAYDNTVTSHTASASLADLSATMTPNVTGLFTAGVCSLNVVFEKAMANNKITVIYNNKSGASANFNVIHDDLYQFIFDPITSPKIAGTSFKINISAYDKYNNVVTSFQGNVGLTDISGSLNIVSDNFENGELTDQTVLLTKFQTDNYITANDPSSSKIGQSNLFNVKSGNVSNFYINPISSPQTAGEWFSISVVAQDNWDNTVNDFSNKVKIEDISNTITPVESQNFAGGQWTGSVKISSVHYNNVVTVQRIAGSETGSSNTFNVVSGNLDHFTVNNISSPQIAGNIFGMIITAKDVAGNTDSTFSGQVSLSDLSNSINPQSSANFVNGSWSADVTITKSRQNNKIYVSGNNKNGVSNSFDVTPDVLDHFNSSTISSPQTAGNNILISLGARDRYENIVSSFTGTVNFSDKTGTIDPPSSTSFSAGTWTGNLKITKAYQNNSIFVHEVVSGVKDTSNAFNINAASLKTIVIEDAPGGLGRKIQDLNFNLNEAIVLYAAGYDEWGNYVRDVSAEWDTIGDIDSPSPLHGKNTIFKARTPLTSGRIYADSISVGADTTGTFIVGAIEYILIRDAAKGGGNIINNRQITADDTLRLYAAAYDNGDNYLGSVTATWSSDGGLQPNLSVSDTMAIFSPTTANVSGQINAFMSPIINATTGLITVRSGAPYGAITLHPNPKLIPAHPDSFSIITSDVIRDADGNLISSGKFFIVSSSLGVITTPDEKPEQDGHWISSNSDSKISFQVNAGIDGGTAHISANSTGSGTAFGDTVLIIASLEILSVSTDIQKASLGQTGLPVRMVIKNVGTETITVLNAGLKFIGLPPTSQDFTHKFNITRTDTIARIISQAQSTLTFLIDVQSDAPTNIMTIDGLVVGELNTKTIRDEAAKNTDLILIQSPPALMLETIETFVDTVIQGTNTTVTATIRNDGDAAAFIEKDSLHFWAESIGLDVSKDYGQISYPSNSDTIDGHSAEMFTYTVLVGANATLDTISLRGSLVGFDVNTGTSISLNSTANYYDGWWVRQASDVEISEFKASQSTVTKGQEEDWYLILTIRNSGGADLVLDGLTVDFTLGGKKISNEYQLFKPSIFSSSGDDTLRSGELDTLIITVDRTGNSLGIVTVEATVFLNDQISGQLIKSSATGVTVQSEAQLSINRILKSKPEVTTGQKTPWNIALSLTNNGGGDIAIDSTKISDFVVFKNETDYSFIPPLGFYQSNNFILKSGRTDSLFYIVDTTGQKAGIQKVLVNVTAREINSQRLLSAKDSMTIKVELPANLKIKQVTNVSFNSPFVDTEQIFPIDVVIQNTGQDAAKEVVIILTNDSLSTIIEPEKNIALLNSEITDTVTFNVRASSNRTIEEVFIARIDAATAENTGNADEVLFSAADDSSAIAKIQVPAHIKITSLITSVDMIKALSRENWEIRISVNNSGESDLTLNKPIKNDISVLISDELQDDYTIVAPEGFENSPDLTLSAGETDQLIYEVQKTGFKGGTAKIKAILTGTYLNIQQVFNVVDSTNIYIRPSADVFVNITEPVCPNVDQFGLGHVNQGQLFRVRANIKNSGAERVDKVVVSLTASDYTIEIDTINYIPPAGDSSAWFKITAQQVVDNVNFVAKINSARAHESGLPAIIGASADSIASVRIHSPARLQMNIVDTENVFTAEQQAHFRLSVANLGTAEVDESGLLSVIAPSGYYIVDGENYSSIDTSNFIINQELDWQILPPADASNNDTIKVFIFNPPKDKNTDLTAIVISPFGELIVKTVPSNISIQSFKIISPQGATDDTLSATQSFQVEVAVNISENLDSVRATLKLPENFGFAIGEDSTKFLPLNRQTWRLKAPEAATVTPQWIKVTVYGKTDGVTEVFTDSFSVVVQRQAILVLDDIWVSWPSQTSNILSLGQELDLSVMVKSKNTNQADITGNATLRINFGSTGVTTLEPLIKSFKIDSTVVWRLFAPDIETGRKPITVFLESIPYDENTNQPAEIWGQQNRVDYYVETASQAGITVEDFRITSPIGAINKILSTYQTFEIEALLSWVNCAEIPVVTLFLPPGFTTQGTNPKQPVSAGQQGTVNWTILVPGAAANNRNIWLEIAALDANSGSSISVTSDSLEVDVVNRAEVQMNAQIVSPQNALDQIVSVGDEFVIKAFLTESGDANIVGNYSATLTLPIGLGYSINQSLTLTNANNQPVYWTIKAPLTKREPATINIELTSPPQDENTNAAIGLDAITSKVVAIPITTEEKSVRISVVPLSARNTVARGELSVPMLCLEFSVSGDEYSNNILLKSVKVKLKDRTGGLLTNLQNAISRMAVVNGLDNNLVYGEVTNIPTTNPIQIVFSQNATFSPVNLNQVNFLIDVAINADVSDFHLSIDSSSAFQFEVQGSGRQPKVTDASGQEMQALNIVSESSVLVAADLKSSFGNYPNPFGSPNKPITYFVYNLERATDVKISIYTLVGELVWSRSYNSSEPPGKKGLHNGDIFWDAQNDNGHRVLNGIYVVRIITGDNKYSVGKIAVIK